MPAPTPPREPKRFVYADDKVRYAFKHRDRELTFVAFAAQLGLAHPTIYRLIRGWWLSTEVNMTRFAALLGVLGLKGKPSSYLHDVAHEDLEREEINQFLSSKCPSPGKTATKRDWELWRERLERVRDEETARRRAARG